MYRKNTYCFPPFMYKDNNTKYSVQVRSKGQGYGTKDIHRIIITVTRRRSKNKKLLMIKSKIHHIKVLSIYIL